MSQEKPTENPSNKPRLKLKLSQKEETEPSPEENKDADSPKPSDSGANSPLKLNPGNISFKRASRKNEPKPQSASDSSHAPADAQNTDTSHSPAQPNPNTESSHAQKLTLKKSPQNEAKNTNDGRTDKDDDCPPPLPGYIKQAKHTTEDKAPASAEVQQDAPPPEPDKPKPVPIPSAQDLAAEKQQTKKQEQTGNPILTLTILVVTLALLGGGSYYGITILLNDSTPDAPASQPADKKSNPDTPKNSPINKTISTVANANEQTKEANRVLEEIEHLMRDDKPQQPAPVEPVLTKQTSGGTPQVTAAIPEQPAPPQSTPPQSTPPKEPNPAVVNWIRELRISGVRDKGPESVMIIQGNFYKLGDYVNEDLGIRWIQFEPKKNRVILMDDEGLVYGKKY